MSEQFIPTGRICLVHPDEFEQVSKTWMNTSGQPASAAGPENRRCTSSLRLEHRPENFCDPRSADYEENHVRR